MSAPGLFPIMILTLQLHDVTYTVAAPKDPDAQEMAQMFRGLLVQAGFHPITVEALFDVNAVDSWDLCPEEDQDAPEESSGIWSWHMPGKETFTPTEISDKQYDPQCPKEQGEDDCETD